MRKYLIFAAAALSLAACNTLAGLAAESVGLPPSPQAVANATQLDETALTTVELAYKGARIACEIAVDAGVIHGPNATRFRDINRRAYAAVQAARAAYRAGNAPGYLAALAEARGLADNLLTLTGRNN